MKRKMQFTGKDIPPDISEEERKINMESLLNTLCRANKIEGFSHCIYEPLNKIAHVYIEE